MDARAGWVGFGDGWVGVVVDLVVVPEDMPF